jgi:hypothetical protein
LIATGGPGASGPKLTVVGGNPAVGRAFASFMQETKLSCLDTHTKNPSDNNAEQRVRQRERSRHLLTNARAP